MYQDTSNNSDKNKNIDLVTSLMADKCQQFRQRLEDFRTGKNKKVPGILVNDENNLITQSGIDTSSHFEGNIYITAVDKTNTLYPAVIHLSATDYENIRADVEELNNEGREIFFQPNKLFNLKDVTEFKSFFADFDLKDENGELYTDLDKLQILKNGLVNKVKDTLPPSTITYTRNGIQVYWNLLNPVSKEDWKPIQDILSKKLFPESDKSLTGLSMRLPGTYWIGKHKGDHPKCLVTIDPFVGPKYEFEDIVNFLNNNGYTCPIGTEAVVSDSFILSPLELKSTLGDRSLRVPYNNLITPPLSKNDHPKWKSGEIEEKTSKSGEAPKGSLPASNYEIVCLINSKINLKDELGLIRNRFRCRLPGHIDKSPSATILKSKNGSDSYVCHCTNSLTPIQAISKIKKISEVELIRQFKIQFNIENVRPLNAWQESYRKLIENNLDILDTWANYPTLPKLHEKYLKILIELNKTAMETVKPEPNTTLGDHSFYLSNRDLIKRLNLKSPGKIGKQIKKLALMGLLKITAHTTLSADIQVSLGDWVAKQNKEHGRKATEMPTYYTIPVYTSETLAQAESVLSGMKECGITQAVISRDGIKNFYGDELLAEMFPQFRKHNLSKSDLQLIMRMTDYLHKNLEECGYVLESRMIEFIMDREIVSFDKVKKYLPDLVRSYGFKRINLTNQLKTEFGITSKRFGKVITK